MVTKALPVQFRDSAVMRERILDALGLIILRDGISAVGINKLAREADCDKVLIYRYFEDLDGVYASFASRSDFWWSLEELTRGIEPRRINAATAFKTILRRHADAIRGRKLTLAVLASELNERNNLVVALEAIRERRSLELSAWLARNFSLPESVDIEAIAMLLGVAVNYLAVRARTVRIMSGVKIKSDKDWQRLFLALDAIVDGVLALA